MPSGVYVRKPRAEREPLQSVNHVTLQGKVTTTSALFIGELKDVGDLLKKDFVITLRVFEGSGKFYFNDDSGEAKLILLADERIRELSAEDFGGSLMDSQKLRLSAADPAQGSGPKSGKGRSPIARLAYQCSITTSTREES